MSYGPPPPGGPSMYPTYPSVPANHPRAVTILVLGILGLVCCGVLGIVAWVMGNTALREIDASGGRIGGRGMVQAGRICGIVATALMILGILFFVVTFAVGGGSGHTTP